MGVSTPSGMSRKVFSFIPRAKAPTNLMGVTKIMCQTPFIFTKTLDISSIQPIIGFHLAATLCENGGTPYVMVKQRTLLYLL